MSNPPQRRSPLLQRSDPGKLPAALLAIIVHGVFFGLLVFGVSWQVKQPVSAMAELWDQLPPMRNVRVEPLPPPPPEVVKTEPVKIEPRTEKLKEVTLQPTQAEINLQAKREKMAKAEREKQSREEKALREKQELAEAEKKRKVEETKQKATQKIAEDRSRADQASREATAAVARNASLQDYVAKIAKLIRDRANIPDSVTGRPEIQVRLRLLVNGAIFDAQVVKSSGDKVYDDAVERAINGIRQWPEPENAALFGGRRELNLNIRHER